MKSDNLLNLKLSEHDKRFIKAAWIYQDKIYILCISKHITILTKQFAKKFSVAKENVRIGTIEDLVKEIIQHNTRVILSVRDGKTVYDPLRILHSLKVNIQKGFMVGTKEGILRKFMLIKDYIKEIEKIKEKIFDNIYISTIEASQTALILRGHVALIPRIIPVKMKKLVGRGLEKSDIRNAVEIIETYKFHEHNRIVLPPGKKLDEFSKKAELFRENVKRMK